MSLGWSILLNGSFHDFRLQILSRTMRPLCHGKIQRPQENPQQLAGARVLAEEAAKPIQLRRTQPLLMVVSVIFESVILGKVVSLLEKVTYFVF